MIYNVIQISGEWKTLIRLQNYYFLLSINYGGQVYDPPDQKW